LQRRYDSLAVQTENRLSRAGLWRFSILIPDNRHTITDRNSAFVSEGISFFSAELTDSSGKEQYAECILKYYSDNQRNADDFNDQYGLNWAADLNKENYGRAEYIGTVHRMFGNSEGAVIVINFDEPQGYQDSVVYYVLIPQQDKLYFFVFSVYDRHYINDVKQIIDSISVSTDV
jgi:hypothetical protein